MSQKYQVKWSETFIFDQNVEASSEAEARKIALEEVYGESSAKQIMKGRCREGGVGDEIFDAAVDANINDLEIIPTNPTRMAIIVKDGLKLSDVQQYLPSNYGAFRRPDGRIQITGRDSHGWTMDGYVIPRLSSGLIPAREFTSMEEEALTE